MKGYKMENDKVEYTEGVRRVVWFSVEQLYMMDRIQSITGETKGKVVRHAMEAYLEKLESE